MTYIFGGLKKLILENINERNDKMRTYAEKNKKQLKKKIRKMVLNEKRFFKLIKGLKTPDKLVIEPIEQTLDLKSLPEIKGHDGSLNAMNI